MAKKKAKTDEALDGVPVLPEGCYTDENELWHLPDGRLLADGLYRNGDDIIMYEGIFEAFGFGERPETVGLKECGE